jgi:hypothetical protein
VRLRSRFIPPPQVGHRSPFVNKPFAELILLRALFLNLALHCFEFFIHAIVSFEFWCYLSASEPAVTNFCANVPFQGFAVAVQDAAERLRGA